MALAPASGPRAEHVLAIDLGTGGPKVAVVSATGRIVSSASRKVALDLLPGGGAEQDPDEWWSAVGAASRAAVEESGVAPERFAAVACTGQWSGTVAVDSSGTPLRPAVIWMDSRGSRPMRRKMAGKVNVLGYDVRKIQRWIRLTGGAPGASGKDPTAHILWIREAEPDLYGSVHKFLEPVDWLTQRMTGRFAASFDSIALHWVTDNRRVEAVEYDPVLLEMAGLERSKLPDLVPSASVLGGLRREAGEHLGLPEQVPVTSATGDLHSAAVGSGAVADFDAHLYIGTSSWISCHVPFKKTAVSTNIASIPAALPGRYLVADEHETAGACLDFLASTLFDSPAGMQASAVRAGDDARSDAYRQMDAIVEDADPGSGRVLFTPWLNGERSPVDDHTIRAGFHNLSLATTRASMIRSVYEGVALNSKWLLDAVERFVKRPFESLAFVGGGAKSQVWCQIHADATGRTVKQMSDPVLANARGAAMVALSTLGVIEIREIPKMVPVAATFEPDPDRSAIYGELYSEFVNVYEATRKIHRRLNKSL